MIKAALVSIGVLILCGLENIGHYFGICVHGYTAQIVGCLGGVAFGLSMYFHNLQAWLISLKESRTHKCNHDHNHDPDEWTKADSELHTHLREKLLKKE
jgi:hypothetical protein